MRRWASGLVLLAVLAVALVVWRQHTGATPCRTAVELDGVTYTRATTTEPVDSGDELGTGTVRCGSSVRLVSLNRIPGLDPDRALASPTGDHLLYLAPGVTPQDLPDRFGTVRPEG